MKFAFFEIISKISHRILTRRYWLVSTVLTCSTTLLSPLRPSLAQSAPANSEPGMINEAQYSYSNSSTGQTYSSWTNRLELSPLLPIAPPGRILSCGGQPLSDYSGFSVALYEPDPSDPTGAELGRLLSLTRTEFPDLANNGVLGGLAPNSSNLNPFSLDNSEGRYNFLFDPSLGQTTVGRTYLLLISPPTISSADSRTVRERRLKIEILGSGANNLPSYRATALDGLPISLDGSTQVTQNLVPVPNAEQTGLNLLSLQFDTLLCAPNQMSITKTADRATASPGDIVLYRLAVRNQSDVAMNGLSFSDRLPRGLKLLGQVTQAAIGEQDIAITTRGEGRLITLTTQASLLPQAVMTVIYAARVTPDAVRGSGRNSAVVTAQRIDNGLLIKDGPAIHDLKIRPGILTNYGILIGRVFHDKNFDGEQQWGEPGLPNAVIFLQDGNRIITDEDGLFSLANVQPGYHSGVLELTSVPGYDFAPNHYRREFNSDSRLVRLEPSGMARMNFAVTPIGNGRSAQGSGDNFPRENALRRPQEVQ